MRRLSKILAVATLTFGMTASFTPILAEEVSLISLAQDVSLRVVVSQIKYIEDQGKLSNITIQERKAGCLTENSDSDARTLTLSLEGTRFKFSSLPSVTLEDGYVGMASPKVEYLDSSRKVIGITMPQNSTLSKKGKIILSGIGVQGLSSSTGDVYIKVGTLADEEEYSEVLVARVADYGVTLSPAREYSLTSGGSQNITFSVKEIMPDSLASGKTLEFTLDKGYFKADKSGKIEGGSIYLNGENVTAQTNLYGYDENGYIKSFEIQVPRLNSSNINTLTFKNFEVCAGLKDSGKITLSVSGRGIEEETSAVLGEIDSGADIKIQGVSAAVGVKRQTGGSITISEQGRRDLELGYINIDFEGSPYVNFIREPNVEVVSGDLGIKALGWSNTKDNRYVLRVTKKSKQPSTIKISNFTYSVTDTAPDGQYGVDISGSAISPENEDASIHFDRFMTISEVADNTSNSSDIDYTNPNNNPYNNPYDTSNNNGTGIMNGSSTSNNNVGNWMGTHITQFVLNSPTYTVNGVVNQMDAVPFAKDGRTMVPVRYVAVAAGIDDDNITYKNGIITIKGDKTIYLYLNSKVIMVDGKVSTMATEPVVINQRTYVPVAEIAKVLDLKVDWNSATQTATFMK